MNDLGVNEANRRHDAAQVATQVATQVTTQVTTQVERTDKNASVMRRCCCTQSKSA